MNQTKKSLKEALKHCDGKDCKCYAYYQGECACGADWTPEEVVELRYKLANNKHAKPLTDNKISKIYNDLYNVYESDNVGIGDFILIAKAIEKAHGIE